jgi:hypothetical protein
MLNRTPGKNISLSAWGQARRSTPPCTFILATDLHFLLNKAENLRVMKLSMA